jgi:hypothetical protein
MQTQFSVLPGWQLVELGTRYRMSVRTLTLVRPSLSLRGLKTAAGASKVPGSGVHPLRAQRDLD